MAMDIVKVFLKCMEMINNKLRVAFIPLGK